MSEQLVNYTVGLLIITLFLEFLWWTARIYEITYEGNSDRLPEWMQTWSKTLAADRQCMLHHQNRDRTANASCI